MKRFPPAASLFLQVVGLLMAHHRPYGDAFFLNKQSLPPSPATNTYHISPSTKKLEEFTVRIRSARESDLSHAASFLATSSSVAATTGEGWMAIKAKMDQLIAKSDIEALLRNRLRTIREGKALYEKVQTMISEEEEFRELDIPQDELFLKLWWNAYSSNSLKSRLERCSKETGEDNVWRQHNFALTPQDRSWLHHLQLSAVDDATGSVVGFCEVAMLSNSLVFAATEDQEEPAFAPAISNLATCPTVRRRGVASRLLRSAERYVQRHWASNTLALYVEQNNDAAIALYEKLGYKIMISCGGGDNTTTDMWYMVKKLEGTKKPDVAKQTLKTDSTKQELSAVER